MRMAMLISVGPHSQDRNKANKIQLDKGQDIL